MENLYKFNYLIQKTIVAMIIFDVRNFLLYKQIIKPEFFDNLIFHDIVQIIFTFYEKYNRISNYAELLEEIGNFGENLILRGRSFSVDDYLLVIQDIYENPQQDKYDYTRDKVIEFAKDRAILQVADELEKMLKEKNYTGIRKKMEQALSIGKSVEEMGTFYFENMETRFANRAAGIDRYSITVPTGINEIDTALGGGIALAELGVIMAPMKRGKTIVGVNFAVGALCAKLHHRKRSYNVLHCTLEGSEERTEALYDSRISGVLKDDITMRNQEVQQAVMEFRNHENTGKLIIKHFPANTCSAYDIEACIQNLIAKESLRIDLIIVDYLGLMRSADKAFIYEGTSSGKYYLIGQITKELLSLAQRYKVAIWLLHQSTRGAIGKDTVDLDDSADSIEPMRDADLILTVNQTKEELRENKCRIYIAGGREVEDKKHIVLKMDKKRVKIESLIEANLFMS